MLSGERHALPVSQVSDFFRRLGWSSVSACALVLLLSISFQPVGPLPGIVAAALAIATAARPFDGLLMLAGIGPLATILLVVTRSGSADLRFSEVLVLAFVSGWSAHRAANPRPLAVSRPLFWAIVLLVAAAAASAVVSVAGFAALQPGSTLTEVGAEIAHSYLSAAIPLPPAILLAGGLVLFLISTETCAGSPARCDAVLRMMVAGAAGAASMNILRIVLAVASHDQRWIVGLQYFWSVRVNVHYSDLNAAGSYFAMTAFLAAGLVWDRSLVWLPALLLVTSGLWISGSRTALAASIAAIVAALGFMAISWKRRKTVMFVAIAVVVIVAGELWHLYPHEKNVAASAAWRSRGALAGAALRIAEDHPVFGVGLGRFQELSPQYAQIPELAVVHENAHNNFLQVLAELGAPGLVLFSTVIILALWAAARSPHRSRTTDGLIAGLSVYLLTCLGGHPLLVHGAAYPFWMALGVAAAQRPEAMSDARWPRFAGIVLLVALVVTLPHRIGEAARDVNLEGASVGLSKWQHEPDGPPYRWASTHGAVFVPSAAKSVEIPLHHGPHAGGSLQVQLFIDGRQADTVLVPDDGQWHVVRLRLVRRATGLYSRIDLQVQTATTPDEQKADITDVLMVGKPSIPE
jgi:O-antigen ligase